MNREKQLEEMVEDLKGRDLCKHLPKDLCNNRNCSLCEAEILYEAGFRKQSKGEWIRREKIPGKITPEAVCSNCGREVVYQVIDKKWEFENYCPHCGTKMKGGAE